MFVFQKHLMESLKLKRSRRTSVEITSLLASYKQSGMSAKEFCKTHDITEGVFYKWRSRNLNRPLAKQSAFIALQPSVGTASLFAEVKGIKIYQAVEASYLKELLA